MARAGSFRFEEVVTPRISVVIPCHNAARFVDAAIESVFAQTLEPSELIVVDDASTDGSARAIGRFGDRIKVIHSRGRGAAAARNEGLRASRFGLLAFLDADDLWPPRSLEIRSHLLADSTAEIAFGRVRETFDDDALKPPRDTDSAARMAGTMLIRREVFDRVGLFDESLRTSEVVDWAARADASLCRSTATDEVVLVRRIHADNLMRRAESRNSDVLTVLRRAAARK